MKARIKKTGEVLNIASYATIHVDKCDDWGNPIEYPVSEVEIIPEIEPLVFNGPAFEPNWEQRRYEIARSMMSAFMSNSCSNVYGETIEKQAQDAVKYADALIEELKKTRK